MKRILKIVLWSLLGLVLLLVALGGFFFYKISNGLPIYETNKPTLSFPANQPAVLLFSKTTGYRHGESIEASKPVFAQLAKQNQWFLYETEEGGVFNTEQLKQFKVVIFNNCTGQLLNTEQQEILRQYVEAGRTIVGIHGAGDFSHHWPWYEQHFIGANFSHHPLSPQLQTTDVHVEPAVDSTLTRGLPAAWPHQDEWYVFLTQPKDKHVAAYIDGNKIIPNGNMLWIKDKNFGMGKYHPVAWYGTVGKGKTFYTSMGHTAEVWKDEHFVQLVENALRWGQP